MLNKVKFFEYLTQNQNVETDATIKMSQEMFLNRQKYMQRIQMFPTLVMIALVTQSCSLC